MRVIVTRPEPSATRTAARVAGLGHEPVLLPLFQAQHLPQVIDKDARGAASALVLTSAEAVRAIEAADVDAIDALLTLPVFAVGTATADAARKLGFSQVSVSGGSGRDLADFIRRDATSTSGLQLLYLAGEPRSPGLEEGLGRAGISCRTLVCYRMVPLPHDRAALHRAVGTDTKSVVLLYSTEAALRLRHLGKTVLPELLASIAGFLCLSPAIAAVLPAQTLDRQRIALEPDEDRLLDLIHQMRV